MKHNGRSLYRVELLNLFGINKALHDRKRRGKAILMLSGFLILGLMIAFYAAMYLYALGISGMGSMILPACMCITCFITFFTTTYKANGTLFNGRDLHIVLSFPVRISEIVGSRILPLYVLDLLTSLVILIPGLLMQLYFTGGGLRLILAWLVTLPFLPMVPIVLAVFIGAVITWFSARFRFKNLLNILLSMGFMVVILVFSMNANNFTPEALSDMSAAMMASFQKLYPLTSLYTSGVLKGNLLSLLAFLLISLLIYRLCLFLIGWKYKEINSRLTAYHARKSYRVRELKTSGPFLALYKREFKRYFSSNIYVMNTLVGLILPLIACIALLVMGQDKLLAVMEIPGAKDMLVPILPYAICFMTNMCCTTASSLSLEGRQLYLVKSFPVSSKLLWDSKIALNLSLNLPAVLLCAVLFGIGLNMTLLETFWCFAVPAVFSVFTAVFGMFLNIHFPRFDWANEAQIVKQSMPSFIVIFGSMVLSGILMVPVLFLPIDKNLIHLAVAALTCLLTWLFYHAVSREPIPGVS